MSDIKRHTQLLPPPAWAVDYLAKLVVACAYEGDVEIAAWPRENWPSRVGVTTHPDAFLRAIRDGASIIVIPDDAQPGPRMETAIAHEMVHAMRMPADWYVVDALDESLVEEYVAAVERIMEPFAIMLYAMTMLGATFVRESNDMAKAGDA